LRLRSPMAPHCPLASHGFVFRSHRWGGLCSGQLENESSPRIVAARLCIASDVSTGEGRSQARSGKGGALRRVRCGELRSRKCPTFSQPFLFIGSVKASRAHHAFLFILFCLCFAAPLILRTGARLNLPSRVKLAAGETGAALQLSQATVDKSILNETSNTLTNCFRKRPTRIGEYFTLACGCRRKGSYPPWSRDSFFIVEGFWNKGNFCDACHKRKYGSLPMSGLLDGGLVSRTEAAMAPAITQTQPSTVRSGRSCAFGRLARLFYIAWNDRALMRLAPTRRMGD